MEDYKSILETKLAQAQDTLDQLKSFNLDEKIDRYNQLKAEMASLKTEIEQSLGIDLDQEIKKVSKSKKPRKKIDEVALHASIVDILKSNQDGLSATGIVSKLGEKDAELTGVSVYLKVSSILKNDPSFTKTGKKRKTIWFLKVE
jgi:hypothetical protein